MVFVYAVYENYTKLKDVLFERHYRDVEKVENERPCRTGVHIMERIEKSDAIEVWKQGELCRQHCCRYSYRVSYPYEFAFNRCQHWYMMKIFFTCFRDDEKSSVIHLALNYCVRYASGEFTKKFFSERLYIGSEALKKFAVMLCDMKLVEMPDGLDFIKSLLKTIRPFNDPNHYKELLKIFLVAGGYECKEIIRYLLDVRKVGSMMTPKEKEELLKTMLMSRNMLSEYPGREISKSRSYVRMMITEEEGFYPTIAVLEKEIQETVDLYYNLGKNPIKELDTFTFLLQHDKMKDELKKYSALIVRSFRVVMFTRAVKQTVIVLKMLLSHPDFDPAASSKDCEEQLLIRNLSHADPRNQEGKDRILLMLNMILDHPRIDPSVNNQEVLSNFCKNGFNPQCVRRILKHPKVDVSVENFICLKHAVDSGCIGNVICLLKEGGVPIDSYDNYLMKNIGKLKRYGFKKEIKKSEEEEESEEKELYSHFHQLFQDMIELGADFSVGDQETLFSALENSNFIIIELLFDLPPESGVDPSARDNTALDLLCSRNKHGFFVHPPDTLVRKILRDKRVNPASKNSSALKIAVKSGYVRAVELLLEDGRSNPTDCLKLACENRNVNIIRLLAEEVGPNEVRKNNFEVLQINQRSSKYYTRRELIKVKEIFLTVFPQVVKEFRKD